MRRILLLAALAFVSCSRSGPEHKAAQGSPSDPSQPALQPAAPQAPSRATMPPAAPDTHPPPVASEPAITPEPLIELAPGLQVDRANRLVFIQGLTCLEAGWLEQAICGRATREHESLVVTAVPASRIHAALLLIGLTNGAPGSWRWEGQELHLTPPTGDPVSISVRYERGGRPAEHSIAEWICGTDGRAFPHTPWVFAGSLFIADPAAGGAERYVADSSGSIAGLVTFGDELLGRPEVLSDQEAVQPPEWIVCPDRLPQPGTPVQVILSPATPSN